MKKSLLYSVIIISVLVMMGLLSLNNGKIGITNLHAYDPAYAACAILPPYVIYIGPNLVNAVDTTSIPTCNSLPPQGPPYDTASDYIAWITRAPFPAIPPPIGEGAGDPLAATGNFGIGYMKITWTGSALLNSAESMYLPWEKFENVGSDDLDTFNSRGDWSKYGYIRFSMYCNEMVNGGGISGNGLLSQTASIFDGSVTKTVGPVCIRTQSGQAFKYTLCASLNFLANSYEKPSAGPDHYFGVSTVSEFIVNAAGVDYTTRPGYKLVMYYDYLTLGAKEAVPVFGGVSGGIVTTASGALPVEGANIKWNPTALNPMPTLTPAMPMTGYHVFRSENYGGGTVSGHPYVSVDAVYYVAGIPSTCPGGICPSSVTSVVDPTCPGGFTFCYKVLVLNNGPTGTYLGDQMNTINATYHESLLDDVPEICGWVEEVPSPTATRTITYDPTLGTFTCTPTITPTITPTAVPTGIDNAHVYPNPFNPLEGSKNFYVDNVELNTNVYIYAMDGALVMKGSLKVGDAHFVPGVPVGKFVWDGKNKNGTRVVSGLYYLVLEDPDKNTRVLRIIVCYKCKPVYQP